jgi:hypothetical protein
MAVNIYEVYSRLAGQGSGAGVAAAPAQVNQPEVQPSQEVKVEAAPKQEPVSVGASAVEETKGEPEFIEYLDESGKLRKAQLPSNPEKIRDHVKQSLESKRNAKLVKDLEEQLVELKKVAERVGLAEKHLKAGKVKEVVDLLANKDGTFDEYLELSLKEKDFLSKASEAEKEAFLTKKEKADLERKLKERDEQTQQEQSQLEAKKAEAVLAGKVDLLNQGFSKHRLAGKLGNSKTEHVLDKAMWDSVAEHVDTQFWSKGLQPSKEDVERLFKEEAAQHVSLIDSKVQDKLEAKKAAAQVALSESSGVKSTVATDFRSELNALVAKGYTPTRAIIELAKRNIHPPAR